MLQEYFAAALDADDNLIGTYTLEDGTVVVLVQDDQPEKLDLHQLAVATAYTRGASSPVVYEKAEPFKPLILDEELSAFEVADPFLTRRHRPAPGGVSIGHYKITAGTLGGAVRDKATGKRFIISNNHVLANIDQASENDPIVQPGAHDGGKTPADTIARLRRWIPLRTDQSKYADAACAEVINPDDVSLETYNLGFPTGVCKAPYIRQELIKTGRTTGTTRGPAIAVNAAVKVNYGAAGTRTIKDCIVSSIYGSPGDSGSPVYDMFTRELVALLFAGGNGVSILCKAIHFMDALGVELFEPPYQLFTGLLDLSHWQDPIAEVLEDGSPLISEGNFKANALDFTPLTFKQIKDAGYKGVILKACQPGYGIDPRFHDYYDWAVAQGLLVGAYIFSDPKFSAKEHFDLMVECVGDRHLDFPPDVDIEVASGKTPQVVTAVVSQLLLMLDNWYAKDPAMVYSSISFIHEYLLPWNVNGESMWNKHPLHLAWWSKSAFLPTLPDHWTKVSIWQVGPYEIGKEIGVGSVAVDCNVIFPEGQKLIGDTEPPPGEKVNLTVTVSGQGQVFPEGGEYDAGSTVILTATPDVEWKFENWSGDYEGTTNPLSLRLDADVSITANFVEVGGAPGEYTHRKAKVIAPKGINVRTGAGTTYSLYFAKPNGWVFEVIEEKSVGSDLWVRVGCEQWVAYRYGGTNLLEYV